ncbi:MAG: Holliday junction resolvase RuvX [Oscillospiraceae bacterium]|jgi:putative Holliday junction resolvase|nr:Holliday junction resolvase RuvX [Oscillospiraceae bacterium]
MRIMAIDLGDIRTGIAICDKFEMMASPVCVIKHRGITDLTKEIARLAGETLAEMIVLGHPKHMNGECGEMAQKSERFAEILKKKTKLDIVLWDERNTTVMANRALTASGRFGKGRKEVVDAVAATLILESYLAFRKNAAKGNNPGST